MYIVETYDASDDPGERQVQMRGQYARAADALAAAQQLIEENLVLSLTAGLSANDAFEEWRQFGDVPKVVARAGAPPIHFDPFVFAQKRAQELQRRV